MLSLENMENSEVIEQSYDKNIVGALSTMNEDDIRQIVEHSGEYTRNQIDETFDKLGLIEALSDTDMPEHELKGIYKQLGLNYDVDASTFSRKQMDEIFD